MNKSKFLKVKTLKSFKLRRKSQLKFWSNKFNFIKFLCTNSEDSNNLTQFNPKPPPPHKILTKDSVTIAVDAVVYYRVQDATMSIANVENSDGATRLLAQTTLRNALGTKTLQEILVDRDSISSGMQVSAPRRHLVASVAGGCLKRDGRRVLF